MSGISNLRSERYRLGMSQEELGELVGRRAPPSVVGKETPLKFRDPFWFSFQRSLIVRLIICLALLMSELPKGMRSHDERQREVGAVGE